MLTISRKEIKRIVVPDLHGSNGDSPVGCYAQVEFWVRLGEDGTQLRQELKSGGLWDIDVASNEDPYLEDVFEAQREELEYVLCECGFTLTD
jgi:hypothetical protein